MLSFPPFTFAALCSLALVALSQGSGTSGLTFDFPNTTSPEPFVISVDGEFIDESLAKVKGYRSCNDVWGVWTNEGPPSVNISQLATYWTHNYDWFDVQAGLNSNFSHYATTVSGSRNYSYPIPLHYVHERSSNDSAVPLLLLHGWPSSYLEWKYVIEPLTSDFHVIAPDLPGFGFSPAPQHPGMGPREMGAAFDALMHQLGYDKYGIVTTDLGWDVGMWMVGDVGKSILGHLSSFYLVYPTKDDVARLANGTTTAEETGYINAGNAWTSVHSAYQTIHAQKPQAISLAMADSPIGFTGWVWDLLSAISDGWHYNFEEIINISMMLWIPGPYGNIRTYLETGKVSIRLMIISSLEFFKS